MIMNIRKQMKSQKGFTLVELMVVIAILGILAAIAIPRFADSTVAANTAKAAADLRTIDSAISMYQAEHGTGTATVPEPADIAALVTNGYLAATTIPPTGNAFINSTSTTIVATAYALTGIGSARRATLDTNNAEDFHR